MDENYKIRIVQRWIPEYRVALLQGVAARFPSAVSVWAAARDKGMSCPLSGVEYDYSHSVHRIGPIQWQKRLSTQGLRRGDVLVVCGDVHNVSVMLLSAFAKIRGVGVIWWGHHKTANSNMTNVRARLFLAKWLTNVYLCYTKTGIEFLRENGFKRELTFATGNTIDQAPIKAAIRMYGTDELSAFRRKHGLDGKRLILTCGVVHKKMRLHQLIKAISRSSLVDEKVVVAVIGDGPELEGCMRLAKEIGVDNRIIWLGATRDQRIMAPWFLSAKVFVYPGAIGLSIMHAFSYAVPVITHSNISNQMPEFEAMEDGKTGLLFEENNIDDLAKTIKKMISNGDECISMGQYAQQKVFRDYTMDKMVNNFAEAIEAAHKITAKK